MVKNLKDFVLLSKAVGQRFDMVQAGGGNISVKCDDGTMLIKASGICLSEVEHDAGVSVLIDGVVSNGVRPSMEVGMHALLETWVLHTHPLAVGIAVCSFDWKALLSPLFPEALLVDYCAPGEDLAKVLQQHKSIAGYLPSVIFLQNHGLVVHAASAHIVLHMTEEILLKLERALRVNFDRYKRTTIIADLFRQQIPLFNGIAYLSDDGVLQTTLKANCSLFNMKPCFPDAFVYAGYEVVRLSALDDKSSIACYVEKYATYPSVIIYQDDIFFLAHSVRKAQEAAMVFKAQLLMAMHRQQQLQSLTLKELCFLAGMSSEQYRQTK